MVALVRLENMLLTARMADRWFVRSGARVVGLVSLELLERGVDAGRVPLDSLVKHEAWRAWSPLNELAELDEPEVPVDFEEELERSGVRSIASVTGAAQTIPSA